MDPLTVLGLVSNIVQLVDAGISAVKVCREIYRCGATSEHLRITETSDQLQQCYSSLSDSLKPSQTLSHLQSGTDLNSLVTKCCQTARILHNELKSLQNSQGGGRRVAFSKFILSRRKAGEIRKLQNELDGYQKTLDTRVLVDIRQFITAFCAQQDSQNTNLDKKFSDLATALATCRISTADNLRTVIETAAEANKREHEATREHVVSHVDNRMLVLTINQAQQQELQKRQDQFLESLRFDDINARQNEISQSYPKTFGWVFDDDDVILPWDSLSKWLKHGHRIYWINGKAGSGKSTIMKFIAKDERTHHALETWSKDRSCLTLTFYFWLSGSKLQRSIKGFLCSLLRQIVINHSLALEKVLRNRELITWKRNIGDWSLDELKGLLYSAIESVHHDSNMCIFLDGIDEFDQDEDVQSLLDLIERLAKNQCTKLCISSRPEAYLEKRLSRYEKLRLQDLTKNDMQVCIRDTLSLVYEKCPSNCIEESDIDKFTTLMTRKADGVFLWVHFSLNSLLKGMKNEDDFGALLMRLEELPSGMEQLYQQMWHRLNGDELRYHQEATMYFSYHDFFPLSLFEMLVALREDVQEEYLQHLKPPNPAELARSCEILKTRVLTTCAGLLEVTSVDEDLRDRPLRLSDSKGTLEVRRTASDSLDRYHEMKVGFFHRTARDFLLNTNTIVGKALQSCDDHLANYIKARMASPLQDFTKLHQVYVKWILHGVRGTEQEIDLLTKCRQVCEALSEPDSRRDITRSFFWKDADADDFAISAAYFGCKDYVQHLVSHTNRHVSPYYQGSLFLWAVFNLFRSPASSKKLELASWLAQNRADLFTKQWGWASIIEAPFETLLRQIICGKGKRGVELISVQLATQLFRLVEEISVSASKSIDHSILSMHLDRLTNLLSRYGSLDIQSLRVEMGGDSLYALAIRRLVQRGTIEGSTRSASSNLRKSIKILLLKSKGTIYLCPNLQDSIYLGQAYEKVLFPEDFPGTAGQFSEEFRSRIEEVAPRCMTVHDEGEWQRRIGLRAEVNEKSLVLDPSEDIDESNWRQKAYEKGYLIREYDPSAIETTQRITT